MTHITCDARIDYATVVGLPQSIRCGADAEIGCMERKCLAAFCRAHVPGDGRCPRDHTLLEPIDFPR